MVEPFAARDAGRHGPIPEECHDHVMAVGMNPGVDAHRLADRSLDWKASAIDLGPDALDDDAAPPFEGSGAIGRACDRGRRPGGAAGDCARRHGRVQCTDDANSIQTTERAMATPCMRAAAIFAIGATLAAAGCVGPGAPVLTFSGSVVGREGEVIRRQLERFGRAHPSIDGRAARHARCRGPAASALRAVAQRARRAIPTSCSSTSCGRRSSRPPGGLRRSIAFDPPVDQLLRRRRRGRSLERRAVRAALVRRRRHAVLANRSGAASAARSRRARRSWRRRAQRRSAASRSASSGRAPATKGW